MWENSETGSSRKEPVNPQGPGNVGGTVISNPVMRQTYRRGLQAERSSGSIHLVKVAVRTELHDHLCLHSLDNWENSIFYAVLVKFLFLILVFQEE